MAKTISEISKEMLQTKLPEFISQLNNDFGLNWKIGYNQDFPNEKLKKTSIRIAFKLKTKIHDLFEIEHTFIDKIDALRSTSEEVWVRGATNIWVNKSKGTLTIMVSLFHRIIEGL